MGHLVPLIGTIYCVRYAELQAQLDENKKLREERTCKVCLDNDVNTVFRPCGHLVSCAACAAQLLMQSSPLCPVCRFCVRDTIRVKNF